MVVYVMVSSLDQIDMFKNYSYFVVIIPRFIIPVGREFTNDPRDLVQS